MSWKVLIWLLCGWQFIGGLIAITISVNCYADGWEFCNPYWVYKYNKHVNWFGATVLALGYTVLCPFGALCYWFYKLCTVGR